MRRLAGGLSRRGLRVFFDEWDVLPGDVVVHRTDAAITDAACALVVVSPATATSPRALDEYAALATAGAERNLRFIPVLIGDAALPPFAAGRVWRDFRDVDEHAYEGKVEELAAAVLGTAARGTGAPVREENVAAALPSPPRPLTEPDRPAFVVCYAAEDTRYGEALAGQLRTAGLPVWSPADLRPGDSQFWTIRQQLAFATAVVVLMSPHSQDSDDVTRMILEAMLHQRPFFPVLLDGQRNYHLAHTWYVDVRDGRLLRPDELDLLRNLSDAPDGARPDGSSGVFPAPLARPAVGTVRVPPTAAIERLDTYLAEEEFTHADLQTTAIVLEAADRLDEGWLGTRHARRIPAPVLASVDAVWADRTHGRQGLRAQAALARVRRPRHADFLALSVACGWRSSTGADVPRRYREFTELSGPGPRRGFYPTLRNPQNELVPDWYDQWYTMALAVHLHRGTETER